MRLSEKSQWEERWSKTKKNGLAFDPEQPMFRETHKILNKYLPKQKSGKFLEVGAYPGKYLWYFYKYFGYEPWGVEYVESCARQAREMLDKEDIPAKIINGDFFNLKTKDYIDGTGWDLVVSFGFVEHFDNPEVAIAKHLEVTQTGGVVVVSVPNHAGWNGSIMRFVDKEKWKQHNCMSLHDLVEAFNRAGGNKIIFSGYSGHIGFWNAGVYPKLKSILGLFYLFARLPLWVLEKFGYSLVPNNTYTSPEMIIIAQKN